MCLYYNKKNKTHGWHVAKEDIVCYKVLQVYKRDTEFFGSVYEYSTPYFNMPVRLGETYNNTEGVFETDADDKYFVSLGFYDDEAKKVTGGVYHSFSQVSNAKWLCDYRLGQTLIPGGFIVVKCIIPKGAEFVFGYDGYGCPCFGSKTLTITNEVLVIQDSGRPGFLEGLKGEYPDAEYWERNPCGLR